MSLSYHRTWEVMNDLESAFNRISYLENMIEDLSEAVDNNDTDSITDLAEAMRTFMPVFIRNYDKVSKRAWNNTVIEVQKYDNPYKLTHQELETFFKDVETTDEYDLK